MDFSWGTAMYQLIAFGFVGLKIALIILFIRRVLLNSRAVNHQLSDIEQKLDKMIEGLEKEKK